MNQRMQLQRCTPYHYETCPLEIASGELFVSYVATIPNSEERNGWR